VGEILRVYFVGLLSLKTNVNNQCKWFDRDNFRVWS